MPTLEQEKQFQQTVTEAATKLFNESHLNYYEIKESRWLGPDLVEDPHLQLVLLITEQEGDRPDQLPYHFLVWVDCEDTADIEATCIEAEDEWSHEYADLVIEGLPEGEYIERFL